MIENGPIKPAHNYFGNWRVMALLTWYNEYITFMESPHKQSESYGEKHTV